MRPIDSKTIKFSCFEFVSYFVLLIIFIMMFFASMMCSGCELVNLDPTNAVMVEMRDDIRELKEEGINVRY